MADRITLTGLKFPCESCKRTGLYYGLAEIGGVAVECYKCKGKGYVDTIHIDLYEPNFGIPSSEVTHVKTKDGVVPLNTWLANKNK